MEHIHGGNRTLDIQVPSSSIAMDRPRWFQPTRRHRRGVDHRTHTRRPRSRSVWRVIAPMARPMTRRSVRRDSNPHGSGFEPDASADWATHRSTPRTGWWSRRDSNPQHTGSKPAASSVGLRDRRGRQPRNRTPLLGFGDQADPRSSPIGTTEQNRTASPGFGTPGRGSTRGGVGTSRRTRTFVDSVRSAASHPRVEASKPTLPLSHAGDRCDREESNPRLQPVALGNCRCSTVAWRRQGDLNPPFPA
jgi:hypothetical protein